MFDGPSEPVDADNDVPSEESAAEVETRAPAEWEVVDEAIASPSSEHPQTAPRKKWHDRKWLLVAITSVVALLIGIGLAAPDRQAAKDEAKTILADAKNDASDVKRDARDDGEEIVEDAETEREELLSGVEKEKAEIEKAVEASKGELADVNASLRTARGALATTERTRVQKQKQVNSLNRAIRSSTSLSRQNAVAKARDYLDYSSFSCQSLIEQLQYEKFSASDATHAAKEVGLC